ncbi:hypothetical protein LOK49_LG09G01486 [Camellia lanceoleosa]|uniref:Uncharacterized protein n=1 Tax=Camellia lanceoleosa TaxID=1840588 RepID=A0ACC0GM81_9ERIC|nr:hypothetical protein LOK49_LG09G01486 [Camellia lanceoleosa]
MELGNVCVGRALDSLFTGFHRATEFKLVKRQKIPLQGPITCTFAFNFRPRYSNTGTVRDLSRHTAKVVDLVRRAVPLALTPEDNPRRDELKKLQEKKEEIDMLAHKQVWRILWSGLGLAIMQVGLFFHLTFWELSWDVMEPIAFFITTTTGLVIGFAYFLFTSRDPTYQ